jgi:hypothetical protein
VGELLTAKVERADPTATIEYTWIFDGHFMTDLTDPTLEIMTEHEGILISVRAVVSEREGGGAFLYQYLPSPVRDAFAVVAQPNPITAIEDLVLDALPSLRSALLWVKENAPATFGRLRAGSSDAEIEAASTALGVPFSDQLRQLLAAIGGEEAGHDGLIPMGRFFSLDELMDEAGLLQGSSELTGVGGATMLPFAGRDGCNYCARIRGDRSDFVYLDDVDGVDNDRVWPDLDAFFAGLLESLETGSPFAYFVPLIEDDAVVWEIPDE